MELHHAERPSPPSTAAHKPLAALSPDPEPNALDAAASPAALTPAVDDGPPTPMLCDSPAGVPSRHSFLMLSTAGSAVSQQGEGLGPGLGHAAAHVDDEAAQTAGAPRALTGHAKPRQSGQALPEPVWASGSPDPDEEVRPSATLPATAMQAGAQAEQQDAAGGPQGEHHEALAADSLAAGLPVACRKSAGVMPGQHAELEGVFAHAYSQTAPSCSAAEAGAVDNVPLAAACGEAGTSLPAEACGTEPDSASGARTAAGAALRATPNLAAAAAKSRSDATEAVSKGLSALQEIPAVTADASDPQITLYPTTSSLPGEDALVGGEPVTPPGLLAAMAACGAGIGSTAAPAAGEGLCEGAAEAELPPLDSAGRREVPPRLRS